jgi:hypothetical protein
MGFGGGLKGGGGLFNGDGTLRGFTFTAIEPKGKKPGLWAYIVLSFQKDGKEAVDTQHLFLGGVDQYSFEEGGDTAVSVKDGEEQEKSIIGKKTPAGRFFQTLWEVGQEQDIDNMLPDLENGDPLNFDGIDGLRVTLAQEKDEKGTSKRGQRLGTDGNKYDRTNTIVEAVLGVPNAKAATKGTKPAAGKGAKADDTAVAAHCRHSDKADAIVAGLIAEAKKADKKNKTGETSVSKFKMAALRALAKDSDKDAVQKLLASEDYRTNAAEREIFSYDADGETVSEA